MATSFLVLEKDLTGKSSANAIKDEQHSIGQGVNRLITPIFGAFFKEGLVVKDGSSFLPIDNSKYLLLDFDSKSSMETGKEVYASIVVVDPTVPPDIAIDYQALGGPLSRNRTGLMNLLRAREINSGTMDWDSVTDKLSKYPPAEHRMLLAHIYGMEYIVAGIDRLKEAVSTGSNPVYDRTVGNIDTLLETLPAKGNAIAAQVIDSNINGLKMTVGASTFGLDMLQNLATMPRPISEAVANIGFIPNNNEPDFFATIHSLDAFADTVRKEMVDKNETAISLVSGRYIPSERGQLLALPNGACFLLRSKKYHTDAGITYDPGVYPDGVSETDEFTILRINNSQTTSAGVFMMFSRTQHATYVGTLRSDNCTNKFIWKKLFHSGELEELSKILDDHTKDTKNPHNVNKEHAGLGRVENLPVVTTDDIDKQVGVRKYLTTDTLQYYMKMFMTNVKPPPSPNPTPDPNEPTMDQAQIVFTQCRVPPPDPEYPPKDQFVKSFCDGTDKFGTFTDGAGGTYDKLIELSSDDCKYKNYPAVDTLITKYCDGTTEYGKFADGIGGTVDRKIRDNSPECGAVATKTGVPSEGTPLGSYCKNSDKYSRYADGKGGSYDLLSEKFSKDCVASAGATITFMKSPEVTVGGQDSTSATLAGFTPNSTYAMEIYTQGPAISNGEPFKTTTVEVAIDSTGKGSWSVISTDQGAVPRGTTTNWAYIPSITTKSNVVTTVYKAGAGNGTTPPPTTPGPGGKTITLTKAAVIKIGDRDDTTVRFTGYPPNTSIKADYYVNNSIYNGGQDYNVGTYDVAIDGSGNGIYIFDTIYNGSVPPGRYTAWVVELGSGTRSNTATIDYVGNTSNNQVIVFSKTATITVGDTDQTSVYLTGFTPNSQAFVDLYMRGPNINNGLALKVTTATINIGADGKGQWVYKEVDQGVQPRGSFVCWGFIVANGLKSNEVTVTYRPGAVAQPPSLPTPSPRMVLTLDGVSTSLTIKVYKTVTVTCNFIGFPGIAYDQRNASIGYYLHIGGNDPRIIGPFYINPVNGNATATFETTLLENDRIRGVVTYRVRAEWYSSTGDVSSSYSNQVTATWIDP